MKGKLHLKTGPRYVHTVQLILATPERLTLGDIAPGCFYLANLDASISVEISSRPNGNNPLLRLGPGAMAMGVFAPDAEPTAKALGEQPVYIEFVIVEAA
jgi:hypothetical protein